MTDDTATELTATDPAPAAKTGKGRKAASIPPDSMAEVTDAPSDSGLAPTVVPGAKTALPNGLALESF